MAQTLWSELPPHVREYLILEAPEWVLLALQRMRLGGRYTIPKAGQMPIDVARSQARARYVELKADGLPFRRRIETIAYEHQVTTRTVRRWLTHR